MDAEGAVDENDDGATIAAVTTENSTEVTVNDDRFEVADGNLKLKDGTSLDFEADTSPIEVTLTAVSDGDDATATVSVTINDVNEAPSIDVRDGEEVPGHPGVISSLSIAENATKADAPPLALIEVMDPDAADAGRLTGDAGVAATSVSDPRFDVILDPEDGLWLHLADGVSLDYEDASEITVTVTFTDSAGNTASQDVTVMVTDVNESPVVAGEVPNVTGLAGRAVDVSVDLTGLFDDPEGSGSLRWELSGEPSWLSLHVEYGTDASGNETITGHLRGTPPTTGPESFGATMVTLTARDTGGEAGSVDFYVVVDDANDQVTGVNLLDDSGNSIVEAEVDENDASGVVFGEITVDDIDHPMHPNGMHKVTVSDRRFEIREDDQGGLWLALKPGVALDHEGREGGVITVTVTAVDMNGAENSAVARALGARKYKGTSDSETFTILVNDLNDAPKAGTIGNWWVTVNEDWDAEDVQAGSLLKVLLETDPDNDPNTGDRFPAFTDQDLSAGDTLTYSISGANWVQIDERTGDITNVKGVLPGRGVHRVTVTATDSHGESASASFNINVAHSDAANSFTDDNEDPSFTSSRGIDYRENSGERIVATFTVTDRDQDIPDHLFAIKTVEIVSVQNADSLGTGGDSRNVIEDLGAGTNASSLALRGTGFAAAFRLSEPRKSGNNWTYDIIARDTNPSPAVNTLDQLDPDAATNAVEEIRITVRVTDGTGATDTQDIDFEIVDVNEAPTVNGATRANPTGIMTPANRTVTQSEDNKVVLYINLEDMWSDDRDEADDLVFGASSSASWIEILYGPGEWQDIVKGPDGNTGGGDDLTWGTPGGTDVGRTVGAAPASATDDLNVVIIEIDRTNRNTQDDRGSFTLTARDENGTTGTVTANVVVTDENEDIVSTATNPAVTLSGSSREGGTLRATFNENKDPDLAGAQSPAIVLYTWYSGDASSQTNVIQRGTSNELSLTQANVGNYIRVQVTYYEVFQGQIISNTTVTVEDVTERAVSNSPNDGVGAFTITAGANTLTAAAVIRDGDYGSAGVPAANITYSWQVSANGVGGWSNVNQTTGVHAETDTNTATLDNLDDGRGQYYRAVATYDADGTGAGTDTESVYSHAVRIADVADVAATPTPPAGQTATPAALTPSGSGFPGGTLTVTGRGVSSVQWQSEVGASGSGVWANIPGATGDLSVTGALAGSNVRALVTYDSTNPNNPGVTAIVPSATVAIGGTPTGTAPPVAVADYEVTGSVMGSGHARNATDNAGAGILSGHTVTITDTVPLASLFQDPDTARLSFSAASTTTSLSGGSTANGSYVAQVDSGVLVLNVRTGELTYVSDQLRNHDGDATDGAGNWLNLDITASDRAPDNSVRNSADNAFGDVVIRINVAPTAINLAEGTLAADSTLINEAFNATESILNGTFPEVTLNEEVTSRGQEILATIDVQDQNHVRHAFGTHEVTVTGDDRFMITNNGNSIIRDGDTNGSTWELRLKPGAKFDFETESDADGNPTNGKQIVLTFSATDGGGLSTPTPSPGAYSAIRLVVTVVNNTADDPRRPGDTETPGLKDDEGSTGSPDTDDTADNADDTENDGGDPTPPPPGMSLGGIIEDFIDNMDNGDQDLLEDFLLTIDDSLDIA